MKDVFNINCSVFSSHKMEAETFHEVIHTTGETLKADKSDNNYGMLHV